MSRTLRLAPLFVTAALSSSCVQDDQSAYIAHMLAIDSSLMCQITADQNVFTTQGMVDVGLIALLNSADGYRAAPLVKNAMLSTASSTSVERNNIFVEGFEVELKAASGKTLPPVPHLADRYRLTYAFGAIDPGGVGYGFIDLIPKATLLAAGASLSDPNWNGVLIAHTRAVGKRSGQDFETAWFDLPVQLCDGCLATPHQPCPPGGYDKALIKTGCILGQDSPVTCCTEGNYLTCGNSVPTTGSSVDMM